MDLQIVLVIGIVITVILLMHLYSWKNSISYQVNAIDNRQDVEADYLADLEKEVGKLKGK